MGLLLNKARQRLCADGVLSDCLDGSSQLAGFHTKGDKSAGGQVRKLRLSAGGITGTTRDGADPFFLRPNGNKIS